MREFWISAYTQHGELFGDNIMANSIDELFTIFKERYPDCEIADYDAYEDADEGYASNCHCDTYGICGGYSCPNYISCHA